MQVKKNVTDAINPLQGWLCSVGGSCCFSFGLEFWWLTTKHSSQLAYLPTCKVCNCCKVLFSRSHDFVVLTRCQTWLTLTKCLLKSYSWDAIFFKSNPTFSTEIYIEVPNCDAAMFSIQWRLSSDNIAGHRHYWLCHAIWWWSGVWRWLSWW